MRAHKSWPGAIAPVLMMMLVLLPAAGAAAETSGYAPQNIEQTYKQLSWLCMVRAFCPVTEPVRDVIKRAMAGNASAEYLLGLTLATGDGLPRDPSAAVAWIVSSRRIR
jgi:TPR repeat protein